MTAESPLIPSCPQVTVFSASAGKIAKFILLAFVTGRLRMCQNGENVSILDACELVRRKITCNKISSEVMSSSKPKKLILEGDVILLLVLQ